MTDNVIPLFKPHKETTTRDYKIKLDYLLERELSSLEDFRDFSKFLCAMAMVIADVSILCAYETGKAPDPSVYTKGFEKVLRDRYIQEGFKI